MNFLGFCRPRFTEVHYIQWCRGPCLLLVAHFRLTLYLAASDVMYPGTTGGCEVSRVLVPPFILVTQLRWLSVRGGVVLPTIHLCTVYVALRFERVFQASISVLNKSDRVEEVGIRVYAGTSA